MSRPIQLQLQGLAEPQFVSVQSYFNTIAAGGGTEIVAIGFVVDCVEGTPLRSESPIHL